MPTIETTPRTFEQLIDRISVTPFPAKAKIRVTITGLAFCWLDTYKSKIYFLTHVEDHLLKMAVIKRVRSSGAVYPARTYDLEKGDEISIKVNQSQEPPEVSTSGTYPLTEMVNLNAVHGNNPIKYIGPSDEDHPHFPTRLSIKHAAFYTMLLHPRLFVLREHGTANQGQPDEVGYIMNGLIAAPPNGNTTITANDSIFRPSIPLPGMDGADELVYDIIFDNHCDPNTTQTCNQRVRDHGGPKGTDFFYYYDVLREEGDLYRQFCLEHLVPPPELNGGEGGGNTGTSRSGQSGGTTTGGEDNEEGTSTRRRPTDVNPERPGGSGEIAACNPVIVDPDPFGEP